MLLSFLGSFNSVTLFMMQATRKNRKYIARLSRNVSSMRVFFYTRRSARVYRVKPRSDPCIKKYTQKTFLLLDLGCYSFQIRCISPYYWLPLNIQSEKLTIKKVTMKCFFGHNAYNFIHLDRCGS